MKLTALLIVKQNGDQDPLLLGMAADLSEFGYFSRGTVKEAITFSARTIAKRTAAGTRHSCQEEAYLCHCHNRDGVVGLAFVDKEYPSRSAFCVVNKVLDDFFATSNEKWRSATADSTDGNSLLEASLAKYQDPAQADKLTKIQRDLDETKVILHQTIESMLDRGEKLENLVGKSADLSLASQVFYKQARKTNSCCKMM